MPIIKTSVFAFVEKQQPAMSGGWAQAKPRLRNSESTGQQPRQAGVDLIREVRFPVFPDNATDYTPASHQER
jgi:hypothetical protein